VVASCGKHTVIWNFRRCVEWGQQRCHSSHSHSVTGLWPGRTPVHSVTRHRGPCFCNLTCPLASAGHVVDILAWLLSLLFERDTGNCCCCCFPVTATDASLLLLVLPLQGEVCCVQQHLVWWAAHSDGLRA
jgi:hypothetical protein